MKHILIHVICLFACLYALAQNPIVTENQLTGNPISEWGVPDFRDNRIAGFSTNMSLNSGETVRFKIDVQGGANFMLKIYRIGYYQGNGARLIANLGTISGTIQPAGISDPVTGMFDCGNWSESASWNIPASAVSGLYVARIERSGGGSNHIAFVVRNDASNSDLYFQMPDATWQAYNGYGGNSIYDGNTSYPAGHAVKVSYNRPFFPYNTLFNTDGRGSDWYMNSEYSMIRWLERNGYDVTYTGGNDVHNNGARLLNHKVLVFAAHDEYWSKEQRNNVEAARAAGVHLAFFTGNEVYWKIRWEDNNGSENRTLVCYKEGKLGDGSLGERTCGSKCDATSSEWTGLWRTGGNYDAGRPENELNGQISWTESPNHSIEVPSHFKKLRFWRNTTVPSMTPGQVTLLGSQTLGYEWNFEQSEYKNTYPHGRITMSSTTVNGKTHMLSLFRHSNGALVFGAGTVQWSWGLDGKHKGGTTEINKNMQQATVNLFADMGVQPATLQSNLVAATQSTDFIAPTSTITAPSNGASFPARSPITISGSATDAAIVAGVEISVDGGANWEPVTTVSDLDGTVDWSFTWTPSAQGTVNIKTRGFDDSGNIEVAGSGITLNIISPECPCTIFEPTAVPAGNFEDSPLELGVKFRANTNGYITKIRFYKGPDNDGTHIGNLWTLAGVSLAQVTFTNETSNGWQEATLSTPVAVTAGTTYVASYYSPTGHFSSTANFFTNDYPAGPTSAWPLQGIKDQLPSFGNGVYINSGSSAFPTNTFNKANYFVDVVFVNTLVVPASLTGIVTLQGRPAAPHASWQIPVTVDFYVAPDMTTPVFSYNVTTNQSGVFTINNVPEGVYTIAVKNSHTLKRVKNLQAITPGGNSVNFGTLLEGDGVNNNIVDVYDLSLLASTFGKSSGDPGFDARADFNHDGTVNIFDLSLLAANYLKQGKIRNQIKSNSKYKKDMKTNFTDSRQFFNGRPNLLKKSLLTLIILILLSVTRINAQSYVNLVVAPAITNTTIGQSITVQVNAQFTAGNPIDAIQANLTYDPAILQATAVTNISGELTSFVGPNFNNTTGLINFVGVDLATPYLTANSPILSITFTVIGAPGSGSTNLAFNRPPTEVAVAAASVLNTTTNGVINISGAGCTPPTASISATSACDAKPFNLVLAASPAPTGTAPFDLTINGTTYNNIPVGGIITNFTPPSTRIWPATPATPPTFEDASITLGVQFKSSVTGFVKGVRFFSPDAVPATPGTFTGQLWTTNGLLLASGTFTNVTADSWNELLFSEPILITAATTYVASYHTDAIKYVRKIGGLAAPVTNGPLTAQMGGGVFAYGATPTYPSSSNLDNYWADVIFAPNNYAFNLTGIKDALECTSIGTPNLQTLNVTSVDCSTLPVSLINFSATPGTNSVTLRWSTSSEINNLGFEVQRSIDGSGGWITLSFVNGAGTSNSIQKYSYVDENLIARRYYYRLKQIDIDRRYEYSPIVSAVIDGNTEFVLDQNYPNPFRTETVIRFTLPQRAKVNLSLFDMNGRLVRVLVNESKESGTHAVTFNSGTLTRGLYYYKLQTGELTAVKKMTIQ